MTPAYNISSWTESRQKVVSCVLSRPNVFSKTSQFWRYACNALHYWEKRWDGLVSDEDGPPMKDPMPLFNARETLFFSDASFVKSELASMLASRLSM